MGCLGNDQLLQESKAIFLCSPKDDLPYSALDMRPAGGDDNPGQEGSIFGSCWTNFDVHEYNFDKIVKNLKNVTPAEAGVQNSLNLLDSRFRENDKNGEIALLPRPSMSDFRVKEFF
jgi:hypothetical protein